MVHRVVVVLRIVLLLEKDGVEENVDSEISSIVQPVAKPDFYLDDASSSQVC